MARKLSPGTHTIRIKKPGGGTRMQRVNVLKSGKFKFIKNVKGKATPKAKPQAKPGGKKARTSPGRRKPMTNRKMSLPNRLANAGLFALAFLPILRRIPMALGQPQQFIREVSVIYSGGLSEGKFNPQLAAEAYVPVAMAFVIFEIKKAAMKKFRF